MNVDFSQLKFDSSGLIPAIVQDHSNGEVLMVAYMNREALEKTLETGLAHYFSRSRQKLWQKGESSGHVQRVREILYDCDGDALVVKADQKVAACHTGHRSCFYRALGRGEDIARTIFDEKEIYDGREEREVFDRLYAVIVDRKNNPEDDSYTSSLLAGGGEVIGKKVQEEGLELILATMAADRENVVREAADLIYHTWVLLAAASVRPEEVRKELAGRFGTGGLAEKAAR